MQGPEKNRNEDSTHEKKKDIVTKVGDNLLYSLSRLEYIRLKLKRGDKKLIAEKLAVHPEWVSQVIRGKGVSEPVLLEAEKLIGSRTQ